MTDHRDVIAYHVLDLFLPQLYEPDLKPSWSHFVGDFGYLLFIPIKQWQVLLDPLSY